MGGYASPSDWTTQIQPRRSRSARVLLGTLLSPVVLLLAVGVAVTVVAVGVALSAAGLPGWAVAIVTGHTVLAPAVLTVVRRRAVRRSEGSTPSSTRTDLMLAPRPDERSLSRLRTRARVGAPLAAAAAVGTAAVAVSPGLLSPAPAGVPGLPAWSVRIGGAVAAWQFALGATLAPRLLRGATAGLAEVTARRAPRCRAVVVGEVEDEPVLAVVGAERRWVRICVDDRMVRGLVQGDEVLLDGTLRTGAVVAVSTRTRTAWVRVAAMAEGGEAGDRA